MRAYSDTWKTKSKLKEISNSKRYSIIHQSPRAHYTFVVNPIRLPLAIPSGILSLIIFLAGGVRLRKAG